MAGIVDLATLLSEMSPQLEDREYVFASVEPAEASRYLALDPLGFFREAEGLTLILERSVAESHALAASAPMRCITLTVHSSLEAVGLTAAIATELAGLGISANVVAAYYHDHVFVPCAQAEQAVAALAALGRRARKPAEQAGPVT